MASAPASILASSAVHAADHWWTEWKLLVLVCTLVVLIGNVKLKLAETESVLPLAAETTGISGWKEAELRLAEAGVRETASS